MGREKVRKKGMKGEQDKKNEWKSSKGGELMEMGVGEALEREAREERMKGNEGKGMKSERQTEKWIDVVD